MSDNEDLLGDDLGDQSLADYNLGNDEEDQLLADDYESGGPQNVPISIGEVYSEPIVQAEYSSHAVEYTPPPMQYQPMAETECVVPNISDVPNLPMPNLPQHSTYAPIEPRHYEAEQAVPPAIPAAPRESPQIVPSELSAEPNGEVRERFVAERPVGAQRMPQVRDIPDSLDKVVIPRGMSGGVRGRSTWRAAHFYPPQHHHPYRTNNTRRGSYNQRHSFPPQIIRPNIPPQIIRQEIRPNVVRAETEIDVPEMETVRPDMPQMRPEIRNAQPPLQMGPEISPERPILPDISFRPPIERSPFERPPLQPLPRYQFGEQRPMFNPVRPTFERPMYLYRQFPPRYPPAREGGAGSAHMQLAGRQEPDNMPVKEPEVRMLPVPLPPHIPPGGLAGKKVLINPHFKGNFQPPVEGLPAYIPTRIQKSPPLSPTKFGPIKDIDDAAERFIAEQRNALARAAGRKFLRRSPQRYIENTTIEIENELARCAPPRRRSNDDDDLLRRQEEFINANRAGLRRRMRSPSPPAARRSPSPRRARPDPPRPHHDAEESDYKRRVREQETLRERVLRAKEVRRRKNAQALHKQMQDRERENQEKHQPTQTNKENQPATDKDKEPLDKPEPQDKPTSSDEIKPDTTRRTPDRKSPEKGTKGEVKPKDNVKEAVKDDEVNSTCEALTPPCTSPARTPPARSPPARSPPARTPPWAGAGGEDDDLELILGDIDGILSDDEDSGRFKDKPAPEPEPPRPAVADLRSKLPPKSSADKPQRQKIVFAHDNEERKRKEKTPPRRPAVGTSKIDDADSDRKPAKTKSNPELVTNKSRQRITFDYRQKEMEKEKLSLGEKTPPFSNRRVILQRKGDSKLPAAGIFSRAVRTALADTRRAHEPHVEFGSDSDGEGEPPGGAAGGVPPGGVAVGNLPHGMTDTRLRTLAGADVQNLILDKEERSAKITFKTTGAAVNFKKKFNGKMVAASRLSVTLI